MNNPPAIISSQRGVRVGSVGGRYRPIADEEYMSRHTSGRNIRVMLVESIRAI